MKKRTHNTDPQNIDAGSPQDALRRAVSGLAIIDYGSVDKLLSTRTGFLPTAFMSAQAHDGADAMNYGSHRAASRLTKDKKESAPYMGAWILGLMAADIICTHGLHHPEPQ